MVSVLHVPFSHPEHRGGGEKDDDYVTRIEFRLLLVSVAISMLHASGVVTCFDAGVS